MYQSWANFDIGEVFNQVVYLLSQDTMVMGADYYQTEAEIASLLAEGKVPIGVGQNTKIRYELFIAHTYQKRKKMKGCDLEVAKNISFIF